MIKRFVFLLLLSVFLVSGCNKSDELSGKTFNIAYTPVFQEDIDSPNRYDSIITLEFLNGKKITNSISNEDGTYELNNDELVLHFKNENENLEIKFSVKESDKDFSKYYALIDDVKFNIKDNNKISHFKNLTLKLDKDRPIEFLKIRKKSH